MGRDKNNQAMRQILFKYPEHIEDVALKMEAVLNHKYAVESTSYKNNLRNEMPDINQHDAIVVLIDVEAGENHWVFRSLFKAENAILIVSLNQYRYEEEFYCPLISWELESEGAKRRFINRLPKNVEKRLQSYEKSNREPDVIESSIGCLIPIILIFLLFYFSIQYGVNSGVDGAVGGGGCRGRRC